MAFAFEIENRVDDVFQRFRPRNHSLFGHMAYQKNGHGQIFREQQELPRDLADLRDRSGRALQLLGEDGLNRVDNDRLRLQFIDFVEDALEVGFGEQVKPRRVDAQPLAAELDLTLTLFA